MRATKGDSDFTKPDVMIDFLNKNIKSAGPEAIGSKTYKVCVDGEKINNSKRGDQAKIDLLRTFLVGKSHTIEKLLERTQQENVKGFNKWLPKIGNRIRFGHPNY